MGKPLHLGEKRAMKLWNQGHSGDELDVAFWLLALHSDCCLWFCCSLRHYFANKGPSSQGYGFSSGHVWMWELDCEESWALKNWCFWTGVLEKTLESPLDCKEIQPVHSEGDQPWDFFGRNDAKAETLVLWPPHTKSWLIGKDSDAGRDGEQEEKGTTEDEMAGWHHWLNGRESEWTPGVGDGQGGLACCDSWGWKESDTTERLNWTELNRKSSGKVKRRRHMSTSQNPSLWHPSWLNKACTTRKDWVRMIG